MNQTTDAAGLQLIESFEGLPLTSYQDSVGVWTIGYGHTVGKRLHIRNHHLLPSQQQARKRQAEQAKER